MKKIAILASALLLVTACKNDKTEAAPDATIEKPADTLKKDTIATAVLPVEETVTETAASEEKIVVQAPEGKEIKVQYATFGSKISSEKALTAEQMMKKYASLKKGDTVNVKFRSKITDVCKKKGCWMSMELPNKKESFVRFKDYGFFVPLNADNSEAIVSGKAFLDVVSVDELKHYAKDGGKSQEEIDKITQPKVTYAFTADGVLIEQ
ncbi:MULTISPECIES: DUF4920 domain-containing protein [unclassified Flavobacterium]|uniref:DUF4920 domain-containing protein n=1 Tax=unclassified Flavobacterium TaxID=196869 RepID=UPI0025BAED3D|nr:MULTISPECIES: DUF4920 domain-containing protein [unclassified Flavobacterium]